MVGKNGLLKAVLLTSRKEQISHEIIYFWYDFYASLTMERFGEDGSIAFHSVHADASLIVLF